MALENGQSGYNWVYLALPTFGNEHKAERNAGVASTSQKIKRKGPHKQRESLLDSPVFLLAIQESEIQNLLSDVFNSSRGFRGQVVQAAVDALYLSDSLANPVELVPG